jgi:hypothetical protein
MAVGLSSGHSADAASKAHLPGEKLTSDDTTPNGLWLGGIAGRYLSAEEYEKFPAVVKLGRRFAAFQNSPYRGEWGQNCSLTFGWVRDLLIEVSNLVGDQNSQQQGSHDAQKEESQEVWSDLRPTDKPELTPDRLASITLRNPHDAWLDTDSQEKTMPTDEILRKKYRIGDPLSLARMFGQIAAYTVDSDEDYEASQLAAMAAQKLLAETYALAPEVFPEGRVYPRIFAGGLMITWRHGDSAVKVLADNQGRLLFLTDLERPNPDYYHGDESVRQTPSTRVTPTTPALLVTLLKGLIYPGPKSGDQS